MKKILSLVLALALVLAASAAFADVPGNIKDIEGLPEMPEVPTMTTSVSGTTETIVVSEKLNWLNWINDWNWNQIEWSEDGLTGTFSLAGLNSQVGMGKWKNYNESGYLDWWNYSKDEAQEYGHPANYDYSYSYGRGGAHVYHNEKVTGYEPGFIFLEPEVKTSHWLDEDGYIHWYKYAENKFSFVEMDEDWEAAYDISEDKGIWDKANSLIEKYPALEDEILGNTGYWFVEDGVDTVKYDEREYSFGVYELGATVGNSDTLNRRNAPVYAGMAFDGEAANGAHVRYDRFGRVISITSTLTGVNFLNMENEPVKTEVTWGVSVTEYGRKFYIASIKAYIDDETAVEAGFASGGKLLKVK